MTPIRISSPLLAALLLLKGCRHCVFFIFLVTFAGIVNAQLCSPGSFSATGLAPCTLAFPGTYVPTSGATSTTLAPGGTYIPGSGASSLAAAITTPLGTYAPPVSQARQSPQPGGARRPS